MSGIGLTGSHGSGKTTLAQAFSETFDVTFLKSNASQVIIDAGYNPSLGYNFATRLKLQKLILASAVKSYEDNGSNTFVSDRTPLDFLAYLLSDVGRNTVNDELYLELADFSSRCYQALNKYFNVVVVVQPGVELVEREGKGSANSAYVEHFNTLICGLAVSSEMVIQHTFIPRQCTDLNRRVAAVEQSVKIAFNSFERVAAKKGAISFSKLSH